MKELTIEEKAKAYDKVRKKIAIRFGSNVADEFFAEFEESEDEKVRKDLIGFFRDGGFLYHKKEEIVEWLEKQGDYANFRDKAQVGDRITKNEDGVLVNLSQLKRVAKPADTVEPKFKVGDKIYLKPEYRMPSDDTPIANTVKEIIGIDDKHYRFDGSYIFIEDQDKYELVEQKLAENAKPQSSTPMSYGKELEKRMYEACNRFFAPNTDSNRYSASDLFYAGVKAEHVLNTLAWSEEDEKMMAAIEHHLNNCGASITSILWLKSLRPQNRWKPSELQLGCLSDAIEHYNSLGYPASKLKELYEQLKKL